MHCFIVGVEVVGEIFTSRELSIRAQWIRLVEHIRWKIEIVAKFTIKFAYISYPSKLKLIDKNYLSTFVAASRMEKIDKIFHNSADFFDSLTSMVGGS